MNKIIETIKSIHNKDICMFKTGTFYHIYGKDADIMSYLFNYKTKEFGNNEKECGFPSSALAKVMAKLENCKINYLTLDRRNNYDIDNREDYKNLNKYDKYYEKANEYINKKRRIENLEKFLEKNIDQKDFLQIIEEMEKIINERRKV